MTRAESVTVLFACVHNAGRSQIAAAFFNRLASHAQAKAISAGTHPAERVHPKVVEVMREVGIDLASARQRLLTPALAQTAQVLVTMGCGSARGWAVARILLGLGQIFAAVFSFILIIRTGINQWSLTAAVLTCLPTTVSVLLFGSLGPLFRRRP